MSFHAASLQSVSEKSASALDFAYALAERVYWLDDAYVQPFYDWAALRLRDAAISGLYWALVTLLDVSLWLIGTTRQFFARDAQAIALIAFAHAHVPLPEVPALCPATVPLALPSILPSMAHAPVFPSPVVQWVSVPEALNEKAPVLALCPTVVPMVFSSFVPDNSVQSWLTSALPLLLAPWGTEALAIPVSPAVDPVVKKVRKSAKASGDKKTPNKTPRKRSPKSASTAAQ